MEFAKLMDQVAQSHAADWVLLDHGDLDNMIDGEGNYHRAVFRGDVSLSLNWGRTRQENCSFPWTKNFPDKSASTSLVDILWENSVVFRVALVLVDGARAYLPLPALSDDKSVQKALRE